MSAAAAASPSKDNFSEDHPTLTAKSPLSNNFDFDDFTSSSILDFLNKERECLHLKDDDDSQIDVESIFEEINRLSDNTDDRSVDEILREAEKLLLLSKQPPFEGVPGKGFGVTKTQPTLHADRKCRQDVGGVVEVEVEEVVGHEFTKVVEEVRRDSILSDESTPREMTITSSRRISLKDNNEDDPVIEEITNGIETISMHIAEDTSLSNCDQNQNDTLRTSTPEELPTPTKLTKSVPHNELHVKDFAESKLDDIPAIRASPGDTSNASTPPSYEINHPAILNNTFTRPNSTQSTYTEKSFCNKSTNPSPTHSYSTAVASPMNSSFSISREHALKNEIEVLQEKLKDTEERLQSLKIQHDSLSQLHRALRESQSHIQEESELLKLDVQHLNECANVLRAELQAARSDRSEALEVQKVLQTELDESRAEKKKAHEQTERDSKTIKDLHRQCKEMERILMRKHPDSVSALIVAAKNPGKGADDTSASRRLLEQRIAQLESDAKEQDLKAQKILANVQARFNSVQAKYETHIADLETQVLSLQEINTKLNEKIECHISMKKYTANQKNNCTQTDDIAERETTKTSSSATQTESRPNSSQKLVPPKKVQLNKMSVSHSDSTISAYHAAAKEDAHLLATIRGMRVDLAIKEKAMQRLTRELEECKKTIKKLQKEKDAMKSERSSASSSASSSTSKKSYDPTQFSEQAADNQALKEALNKIKLLEFDYKALHDKRLQDLKTLQAAHERELASCHETVRILQTRLSERDEAFALQKRRKVPIDYYALKAKVSSLERRHSEREQRLHMLVEALSKGRLNGALEEVLTENGQ